MVQPSYIHFWSAVFWLSHRLTNWHGWGRKNNTVLRCWYLLVYEYIGLIHYSCPICFSCSIMTNVLNIFLLTETENPHDLGERRHNWSLAAKNHFCYRQWQWLHCWNDIEGRLSTFILHSLFCSCPDCCLTMVSLQRAVMPWLHVT